METQTLLKLLNMVGRQITLRNVKREKPPRENTARQTDRDIQTQKEPDRQTEKHTDTERLIDGHR